MKILVVDNMYDVVYIIEVFCYVFDLVSSIWLWWCG